MIEVLRIIGIGAAILIVGFFGGMYYRKLIVDARVNSAEQNAKRIIEDAKKEAQTLKKEAIAEGKEEIANLKLRSDEDIKRQRFELQKLENRLLGKEESLEKKTSFIEKKEQIVNQKEKEIDGIKNSLNEVLKKEILRLEAIAELTREEAKAILVKKMEEDARHDAAKEIKKIEVQTREEADKIAKKIIAQAIQRCAIDHVTETTVSVVNLPNDEMKGRIIGREGRNIRVFENLTGINIIVDDTPEAVILSSFDPVRREIARVTLENLIIDGRIHPARIEEMYEKASKLINNEIKVEGETAVFDTGIGEINSGLIKVLGRLKYRTSYGQNVLMHSKEVAFVAGIIASELGTNIKKAKRAGLLHDIGKALTHDIEGSHALIGAELAKRLHEDEDICHSIEAHHNEIETETLLDVIVQVADAVSGARPGARRETIESYIKRLESLEKIASEFSGIEKSYAIQAGREIRVIVKPEEVNDEMSAVIARDIAKKIEGEMEYPGQIKVTVIRESRAIDYAK
ncbi:MAG: ribonuclease Y [Actinobacteria bacterium]|nr:ribonuclease Y [Actinomycetota bacterium]MCL6087510.1 ribonuclease Y [Actinomycetota bacterium]